MTQRIFDMENEQDVKDLFDILPDCVCRVEQACAKGYFVLHYAGSQSTTTSHVLAIKWGKLYGVDRPVDKSKWIGCLCWLWNGSETDKEMYVLQEINTDKYKYPYVIYPAPNTPLGFENCRPVKRSEIKFVEDMEE